MPLLRLAAVILFVFAAIASFGWGITWAASTIAGLIAVGLACFAASFLPNSPPVR